MSSNENQYQFSFTWKIENFSLCFQSIEKYFCSPIFTVESLSKFKLILYPDGRCSKNHIALFLQSVDKYIVNTNVDIKIECIGKGNKILKSLIANCQFEKENDMASWGWEEFLCHKEIYEDEENLPLDDLTCICYIKTGTTNKLCIEACTKLGLDQISFLWKVKNPISSNWTENKIIHIPKGAQFKVTLSCPENDILIDMQRLSNFLYSAIFIKCKISLLDVQGVEKKSISDLHVFDSIDNQWTFPNFLSKGYIQDENHNFLRNGVCILSFEFSISNGNFTETIDGVTKYKFSNVVYFGTIDSDSTLEDDFRDLMISKKHFDVELKIGETVIPAHKSVLAARSPVFSAMFDHNMTESKSGIINIEDLDVDTINHLLEFLYANSLGNLNYESTSKLLIAADKYQVLPLTEKCCARLMSLISHKNIFETLFVADMINHKNLKAYVIDCLKNHPEIFASFEWCQWMVANPKLAHEILRDISDYFFGV